MIEEVNKHEFERIGCFFQPNRHNIESCRSQSVQAEKFGSPLCAVRIARPLERRLVAVGVIVNFLDVAVDKIFRFLVGQLARDDLTLMLFDFVVKKAVYASAKRHKAIKLSSKVGQILEA